jgi:hypothetical protein
MNEMTQAKATAQTAFGCRNGLADGVWLTNVPSYDDDFVRQPN